MEKLVFTKDWTNPLDFPTYEPNEEQVREDMQLLHDETKAAFDGLIDALESVVDDSAGADQIGATPIKDGGAETVQGIMEELKDVDNHINGSVNKVFTATEKTKLGTIAENAEVNTVDSVNTKTGAVVLDADDIDDTATTNKFTTATEKSKLAGIDENANAYVHPNHSGDVTSVGDGATTIAAKAVTLAKMADMATASLLGRKTADTGVPEVLSKSDAQTLLNVEDGANNYVHPSTDGNLHVPATSTTNNGKVLKAGATAGSIAWADDTDTITTINGKTGAIAKEDITALGIPAQDTVYEHPATHSADIITDGTTNKTFTAVLKSAYDGLVTLFSGISSVVTTLGPDNTSIPTSKAVADAISGAGGGDMLKSTYDPSNIGANVYNADNHIDGTTNKVFTATEQSKLSGIDDNAEVNNISDVNATALTDGGNSALHYHSTDRDRTNHTGTQSADTLTNGTTNKVFTATEQTKLGAIAENANNYSHPTGDGNLHVPANSTTNEGKVLTAGASAGTYTWETPTYGVGEDDRYILVRNGRWI